MLEQLKAISVDAGKEILHITTFRLFCKIQNVASPIFEGPE